MAASNPMTRAERIAETFGVVLGVASQCEQVTEERLKPFFAQQREREKGPSLLDLLLAGNVADGAAVAQALADECGLPFVQRTKMSGTGVGLYICRRLVEMMGGRIWCESRLGVGSRFAFTLPAQRQQVWGDDCAGPVFAASRQRPPRP